jgi:hypothetical protein
LVSKAIVQAVEQRGGRFLERDKKSGMYTVVSYKRVVDKTSQALRERDGDESPTVTTEDAAPPGGDEIAGPPGRLGDWGEVVPNADEGERPTPPIQPRLDDVLMCGVRDHRWHQGNDQFRALVAGRSTSYDLAPSHEAKRRIIREIMFVVQSTNPPGRFLKREPAHDGRWVEVDNTQVMQMTRVALCGMVVQNKTARVEEELKEAEQPTEQEELLKRPEKRGRFDLNNGYAAAHPNYETPTDIVSCPHASGIATVNAGIVGIATVGATRVAASTIPPESAVTQQRIYSQNIVSVSLKLESISKEMQTWAQLLDSTQGATQLACIKKLSSLSQEMRKFL